MSLHAWSSTRYLLSCLLVLYLLGAALPALATVPAPPPDELPSGAFEPLPPGDREPPEYLGPFNYLREFDQIVGFLAEWQLLDPDSSDYGGMIEAESGDLGDVIQTDNTLEAIWCWSRYWEFSGRDTYSMNIDAAWIYCTNYPAWMEEGGNLDYYRVHNCAWGLTAVLRYKAATGDASYDWYAETCADYIVTHPLNIWDGNVWYQRLDAFCKGWAAGNLYIYGEAVGDPSYMAAAVTQGQDVFNWLNDDLEVNMAAEYWAMSSGTCVWGVCNSLFKDDPVLGQSWLALNAHYVDIWQDWYSVPGYVWDSSWNVAYANAHFAMWDVTGDGQFWDNGVYDTDNLLSLDTDDDGGIMAETIDENTEDMSWVTCYLCKFGVDRLMGDPYDHDTGVLRFDGLADGDRFLDGEPIDITVIATNYGLFDETGVTLQLTGDAGPAATTIDLDFAELDTVPLIAGWIPPEPGWYTFTAYTSLPGDEDAGNDTVSVTIAVGENTGVPGSELASAAPRAMRNPFREETGIRFTLEYSGTLRLDIFDVQGRFVTRLATGQHEAGEHSLRWDGRDARGKAVPAGLYLYRLASAEGVYTGKLMRLR